MPDDFLDYQQLIDDAKRDVIRKAMSRVAEEGLPEDHYFHIWFETAHPGVEMSDSLRRQYPDEMPIILQNAFWDLEVDERGFSVTLTFNRVPQRLVVPFDAIVIFQDPPANFGLQFQVPETAGEDEEEDGGELADEAFEAEEDATAPEPGPDSKTGDEGAPGESTGQGATVVPLHGFRKK